ncbi:MAG TPA: cell division protein FtsK [Acidimicrobiaceae bacterium]|nr:cell division protein FtsK [Acidimicrobiaceae bacterium]HAX04108.1 cell division protein FtsK [Acidimicrobiaceae bacterium]
MKSAKSSIFRRMSEAGLRGRGTDVAGLLLLVVALISLLALFGDKAGIAGRLLESVMSVLVGIFRYVVPFALLLCAYAILRDKRSERTWRIAFGGALTSLAFSGMAHLLGDASGIRTTLEDLRSSGGILGALVAEPLRGTVDEPGAWVVLLLGAMFGILIVTDTGLRQVLGAAAWSARLGGKQIRRGFTSLQSLGSDREASENPQRRERPLPTISAPGSGLPTLEAEVASSYDEPEASEDFDATPQLNEVSEEEPGLRPPTEDFGEDVESSPTDDLPPEQMEIDLTTRPTGEWELPGLESLERSGSQDVDERLLQNGARNLEAALASHGVETRVTGMEVGPTVTRYELSLGKGVKVSRVTSLHKDIAYAMASADVRILAPIPGRSAIGVEVPNADRHLVALGDILSTKTASDATHPLEVALGQDISGNAVMANLASMPHVLIAGATGAGKSSCINSVITSLLMRTTPDEVRMILIDPKRVELGQYDRLPHLLTQVVTNPKKAANALSWAVKEMERRYDVLSEIGFRDITGYNAAYDEGRLASDLNEEREFERMPFVVVVVDELNDLMMVAARDVEDSITRLAQMARAVGIHLVIATQRPSVNVITGVIKANIPSRMAFAVSSLADSRVILDQPGAERLIGKGDMLVLGANSSVAQRVQGCWVGEAEIHQVVAHWRRQAPNTNYIEGVEGSDGRGSAVIPGGSSGDEGDDELMMQAMTIIVDTQLGSTSMLQRKLKVGFARAGRLMDLLEQRGVVGPSIGSKARDVLMTQEELDALLADR